MKLDRFFIALSCAALSGLMLLFSALICFVVSKGMTKHWPQKLQLFELKDGTSHFGVIFTSKASMKFTGEKRHQLKVANREIHPLGFKWIETEEVLAQTVPSDAWCIERMEFGDAYASAITNTETGDLRVTYPSGSEGCCKRLQSSGATSPTACLF